jgi:hypothetical protein
MSFYNLIPSICEWYGLEKPKFYDYLLEQQEVYRGSALGLYLDTQGNASYDCNEQTRTWLNKHKLLQYDLMFGKGYGEKSLYSKSGE